MRLLSIFAVMILTTSVSLAATPFPTNTPLDGQTSALWLNSTYEADTLAVDMHLVYLRQQASSELSLYVVVELGGGFYFYPAFSEAASPLATFPLPAGPLDTGVFELVSLPLSNMPAPVPATWYSAFLTQQGELAELGLASSRVLLYASPTPEPSVTETPTVEPTATHTASPTSTLTTTPTGTSTPTSSPTLTGTASPTTTGTSTATAPLTPTNSPSPVPSNTSTPTPSPSPSSTHTATQSATPSPTNSATGTPTLTATQVPSASPTPTVALVYDWRLVSTTGPSRREYHRMWYDSNQNLTYLYGGQLGISLDDMWAWDGAQWTQVNPSNRPFWRHSHAVAYNPTNSHVLLYGGVYQNNTNEFYLEDTWEWNGNDWLQLDDQSPPSTRRFHALAYDLNRNITLMHGGFNGSFELGDTWEWDGLQWQQMVSSPNPGSRSQHSICYDPSRKTSVLWGGSSGPLFLPNPIWEWSGNIWIEKPTSVAPEGRFHQAMVYDSQRQKVVLFGGNPGFNEMWEWDGTSWTQVTAPTSLSRYRHDMVYDEARGVIVLFGGREPDGSDGILKGETWEYGPVTPTAIPTPTP